ncbi:MAG: hypothetical protein GF408_08360 [Candidatus Omnitrophica bacterium]|nr:hypothetical protein [Candidatus Omnitrophota bacterium]
MTIAESVISGLVQGLTEFLPVSSSGHLVLLHRFFGYEEPGVFFDVCLHAGTLLSVLVFFGPYIVSLAVKKDGRSLLMLFIATLPAVGAALLWGDAIEGFFTDPRSVAFFLLCTGVMLLAAQLRMYGQRNSGGVTRPVPAFLMGIAQALALLPGISRSGSTISAGILSGVSEEEAFRFSFLMSIPAITGALVFKSRSIGAAGLDLDTVTVYSAGILTAFVAGILSLYVLRKVLKFRKLYFFGIYCVAIGLTGLFRW